MSLRLQEESRARPRGTEGSRLDQLEDALTPQNGQLLAIATNNIAHHYSGLLAWMARNTPFVSSYEAGNEPKGLASKLSRKKTGLANSPTLEPGRVSIEKLS